MTVPSAGWYDDPELANTRRYWDGTAWTEHRMEKTTQPAPRTSSGGGTWKWIGGIVLAIVLAVVALRLLYGQGVFGGTSVSSEDLASDIESGLQEQGVEGPEIYCPEVGRAQQGYVTICEGTDASGAEVSVEVTFNSDGSYIYQQQ